MCLSSGIRVADKAEGSSPDRGWHIYLRLEDATKGLERWAIVKPGVTLVLCKVKYKRAHHQGLGDGMFSDSPEVVVAYEMMIEEIVSFCRA